jgi:large subunit ribosomal protein L24
MKNEKTTTFKIRQNDQVVVIAGSHKGKKGRVVRVLRKQERVLVEGVNLVKRHVKPTQQAPGHIVEKEASIHISNVALWNEAESRPVKVGFKVLADGQKVRVDRKTGDVLEANETRSGR